MLNINATQAERIKQKLSEIVSAPRAVLPEDDNQRRTWRGPANCGHKYDTMHNVVNRYCALGIV